MKTDKILLSIIIPVYNVEKYLNRCMESLLKEDLTECEIILVDDGSTDSSQSICDQYGDRTNVKVIHKTNGGLSDARNIGIKNTSGEYLFFLDSDDFIEEGAIQRIKFHLTCSHCDVLVFKSKLYYEDGSIEDELDYTLKAGVYTSQEYMVMLRENPNSVLFCAPYHICKRKLVERLNLEFKIGILHEDELWTPQLLLGAKNIHYIDEFCYFHFVRKGSIMNSTNYRKSGFSDIQVSLNLLEIYDASCRDDLEYLRDHMVTTYLQAVWKVPEYFKKSENYSKTMPIKNSYYTKTKMKSLLFLISPYVYIKVHALFGRKRNGIV